MGLWSYIAPEATINNCLNPSAEIAGNFAAVGGGTMTRQSVESFFGVYAYRVQTAANDEGGSVTLDALANAIHYVTVRVRGTLPTSWDWSLDNAAYTTPTQLLDYDGDWALYGLQFSAAQSNGSTLFYMRQNGAGAGDFNVDAIQVEEKSTWTTYCDGSRPGCEWLGAEHGSQSQRSAQSRAGGTVVDFADLDFEISRFIGAGKSPIALNVDNYALLPGGELNSQKTNVRSFTLTGWIQGTSLEDLHANRQALIDAVSINQTPENQPVILRYTGSSVVKEIEAYYQAGLQGNITAQFECLEQRVALRFLATSPNFREVGESSDILDTNDAATFRYIAGRLRSTGQWDDLNVGANPAGGGIVYAILVASDGDVYIGGGFTGWDNVAGRDYVARYTPSTDTWSTVGGNGDFNGIVYTFAEGADGTIYAGGSFTNCAGDANADYVAQWNGAAWSAVGQPVQGAAAITRVRDMVVDGLGRLYIVGTFTDWANIANADYIVRWGGTTYAAVGNPSAGASITFIQAVDVDNNDNVYVGGIFTNFAGDADADRFAWWDGSSWSDLGGPFDSTVSDIVVLSNDAIYAGGNFTAIDGNTRNRIAFWNGSAWSSLGEGIPNNQVFALAYGNDGVLFVGGSFTNVSGVEVSTSLSRWNGSSWIPVDTEQPVGTPTIQALAVGRVDPVITSNYDLFVGHEQTGAGVLAGSVSIDNDGTEDAWPKIIINRSGGTTAQLISIRNETIGLQLLSDHDLADGETLTIDLFPTNKSIISSLSGSRLDIIFPSSDFGIWRLIPDDNQITCFILVSGGPTIEASIVYQDQYWSVD